MPPGKQTAATIQGGSRPDDLHVRQRSKFPDLSTTSSGNAHSCQTSLLCLSTRRHQLGLQLINVVFASQEWGTVQQSESWTLPNFCGISVLLILCILFDTDGAWCGSNFLFGFMILASWHVLQQQPCLMGSGTSLVQPGKLSRPRMVQNYDVRHSCVPK